MGRLTRDGTAERVSRDQILRHAREQGNIIFPCSADHEQDWQPYPVDPYSAICDDHSFIHTYIHTYIHTPLGRHIPSLALVRFLTGLLFCSDFGSGKSEKGVSTYELYRSLMLSCPRSRLRIRCRDTDSVVPSRFSPLIFHTQAESSISCLLARLFPISAAASIYPF